MMKFGKTGRLLAMIGVTGSFFLVELVVGYTTHSMALVADSFHMLSDVMALLVAFFSVRISKRTSPKNTFGWARAEVLGALVNSVFLLALCFSIFVEAIQRFTEPKEVEQPKWILIVGCLGLLVNLIGLALFSQHSHAGHSHGHGHSHDHGAKEHSHDEKKTKKRKVVKRVDEVQERNEELLLVQQPSSHETAPNGQPLLTDRVADVAAPEPRIASSSQLNMRGVFLHVLGDALGSVVVIISALVIWFSEWEHEKYVDPALSIVLVFIISYTTIPLLKESAMILMQTVPTHIEIEDIKSRLSKIDGVLAVHELHIWQLAGDRIIASAHIRCHNLQEYMRVAVKIKQFFHNEGIHSTTMQPEFDENPLDGGIGSNLIQSLPTTISTCILTCPTDDKKCTTSVCCIPTANGPLMVVTPAVPARNSVALSARALEATLPNAPAEAPPSYGESLVQPVVPLDRSQSKLG